MPHPCTRIIYDRYIIVMYVYYSTLDEFSGEILKQSVKNSWWQFREPDVAEGFPYWTYTVPKLYTRRRFRSIQIHSAHHITDSAYYSEIALQLYKNYIMRFKANRKQTKDYNSLRWP